MSPTARSAKKEAEAIRGGDRKAMAKAITLLESKRPDKAERGREILEELVPYTGQSMRVGVTGPPGVGKSTFIEAVSGMMGDYAVKYPRELLVAKGSVWEGLQEARTAKNDRGGVISLGGRIKQTGWWFKPLPRIYLPYQPATKFKDRILLANPIRAPFNASKSPRAAAADRSLAKSRVMRIFEFANSIRGFSELLRGAPDKSKPPKEGGLPLCRVLTYASWHRKKWCPGSYLLDT